MNRKTTLPKNRTDNKTIKKAFCVIGLACLLVLDACLYRSDEYHTNTHEDASSVRAHDSICLDQENRRIIDTGATIARRFIPPPGYTRVPVMRDSYEAFLRNLPLKPHGTRVRYFDGALKPSDGVYVAVVDYDIGDRDLHQCADAIIRLRAEYLFSHHKFDQIAFNFTSGDTARFSQFAEGYRPVVLNNIVTWTRKAGSDTSYAAFQEYLDLVYQYAGTYSLNKELIEVDPPENMSVGDVFIEGGFPGHAVLVVDMAEHKLTGEKIFLLAQSYMPAQEVQIISNPESNELSPWYKLQSSEILRTPEWTFHFSHLKRFRSN
jgi:hypothetical protein